MSHAMLAALKNKRSKGAVMEGDHQDMGHSSQHADDKAKDLHGFVQSLSESDKGKLKSILHADGGSNAQAIAQGGASTEEQGKIEDAINDENERNALVSQEDESRHPQVDSDAIAKSMIDHKAMSAIQSGDKPRNLGERAKMYAAQKLKSKGKL